MDIPTTKQFNAVMAVLLQNVDPEQLDMDVLQDAVVRNPSGAGQQFTLFLKNGGRVSIGDMNVTVAPFDPVKFISPDWKVTADEHDKRNDSLTEVDFNKVGFETCLKGDESSITGEEKLKRLKAQKQIRYGVVVFMGLWLDYLARKENSVLETLFRTKGITYLDFFGDVLLSPGGRRRGLYLYRDGGGRWRWHYRWLDRSWGARSRSVVSSQVST